MKTIIIVTLLTIIIVGNRRSTRAQERSENSYYQQIRTLPSGGPNEIRIFKFQDDKSDCYVVHHEYHNVAISCIKR